MILYLLVETALWYTISMLVVDGIIAMRTLRGEDVDERLVDVYQNSLPFLWVPWLVKFIMCITAGDTLFGVLSALNILIMVHLWKSNHDDRWTKRRKKAESKIREVGGRLIIEPVASPT